MRRLQVVLVLLCLSGAVAAQPVPEECARPANWSERTLCGDTDLTALHLQLQRLYNERRAALEGEAYLDMVSYHHGWLRGREECRTAPDTAGQIACLKDLYQARLTQLSGRPAQPAPEPSAPARVVPEPTLVACRGDSGGWVMELGSASARLKLGAESPLQNLKGRMTSLPRGRTSAWRGREAGAAGDAVLLLMEGACAVEGSSTRFALLARLSLPDGTLLGGCCQRTPVSVMSDPAVPPPPVEGERANAAAGLLPVGISVRLRDVDGPNVALRKSARISSGNVLLRVRAGSVGTVEQAAFREGTQWYFVALRGTDSKGWIMGELVEPLVAVAVKGGVAVEPLAPRIPPAVPAPEPKEEDLEPASRGDGFQGAMGPVGRQWWSNLSQHLLVIDACIERARLRTARIVRVDADGAATRHVYARDGLNNRVVCVVRKGQTVRARVLDRDETFPQAAGPLFTREPGQPPTASCYRNQRVLVRGTRQPAGWLSYLKPGRRCR